MILYSLSNASFTMDVYEDKVIFHPRLWKSLTAKRWENARVLYYAQIQIVELNKKLWPMHHQLILKTQEEALVFQFRKLYPFFERLKLYMERQIIRYYNSPQGRARPMQTVIDLIEEKKTQRKKAFHAA
jgi:hypothetical protein